MTGYTPAEQDIRAARGLPYATGADDPPAWHDGTAPEFTGASGAGLQPREQAETDLLHMSAAS